MKVGKQLKKMISNIFNINYILMEIYRDYENEINDINKITKGKYIFIIDIQKIKENIQNYEHKKNENEMVRNELLFLEEGDVVYKLVGPILVKENHEEAKLNVEKRIEFITKEIQKQEKIFKDSETTIDNKRKKVYN